MHFKPEPIQDFLAPEPEDGQPWLIPLWIKRGAFVLLSGPPKRSSKSLLLERLGIHLASGIHDKDGRIKPVAQCKVLYVGEEAPRADVKMRFAAHLEDMEIAPEVVNDFLFVAHMTGLKLMTKDHTDVLMRWVEEHKPALVMLDPWSSLGPSDENSAEEVKPCLEVIRDMQRLGCAVILALHLKKPSDKTEDIDMEIRGSGMIAGAYDAHIALRPGSSWKKPGDRIALQVRHKSANPWEGGVGWVPTTEKRQHGDVEVDYTTRITLKWF